MIGLYVIIKTDNGHVAVCLLTCKSVSLFCSLLAHLMVRNHLKEFTEKKSQTGLSVENFLNPFACNSWLDAQPRSAHLSEWPFTLFVWFHFPDPLCLSISLLLSPSPCHSVLPTSAVSLAHICLPVVLYHLVCLCLSLFLCRPPASCCTPSPIPPSLSPSVCCQNPLHHSQMLSPWYISTSASVSSGTLPFLYQLFQCMLSQLHIKKCIFNNL